MKHIHKQKQKERGTVHFLLFLSLFWGDLIPGMSNIKRLWSADVFVFKLVLKITLMILLPALIS